MICWSMGGGWGVSLVDPGLQDLHNTGQQLDVRDMGSPRDGPVSMVRQIPEALSQSSGSFDRFLRVKYIDKEVYCVSHYATLQLQ